MASEGQVLRVRLLTSSVVVAGLQTSTSSKVGRGRDTLSPHMYRASADLSTFSGNDKSENYPGNAFIGSSKTQSKFTPILSSNEYSHSFLLLGD